ncbi:MAG: spore coat protein [Bacillota bacterium]
MPSNLTQKERMLLEDQKKHEEICIQKYQNYSAQVQDPQLKQLLDSYAQQEQEHLNSLNQLLSGQLPKINQQQSGSQHQLSSQQQPGSQQGLQSQPGQGAPANQRDASLLTDLLMTEKYVSGTYDTAIFEMTSSSVRQALNHIQKEEQQHGEGIFNYMNSHGMYNPQ